MAVQKTPNKKPYTLRRFFKVFLPFMLLLLVFGGSIIGNIFSADPPPSKVSLSITPEPVEAAITPTNGIRDVENSPTPVSTEFSENNEIRNENETNSIPKDLKIVLTGPPMDSRFNTTDIITFYWFWPMELAENQIFSLKIENDETELIAGIVDQPSLGISGYQFSFSPADIDEFDVELDWGIQLVDADSGMILSESQKREIFIISPEPR